jgi:hypothetical protein
VTRNTRITIRDGSGLSEAYTPVVKYVDLAGEPATFVDGIGTFPAEHEPGQPVTVLLDPKGLSGPTLYSWRRCWLVPTLFLSLGLVPGAVVAMSCRARRASAAAWAPPETLRS